MAEEQVSTRDLTFEDKLALSYSPIVRQIAFLAIASLSLLWGTGTFYYHFFRLGGRFYNNLYTRGVIEVHDFLGVWAVLLFTALPFVWWAIFFMTDRLGGLKFKIFGWLSAVGFLSIACGLLGGAEMGGTFGALIASKLEPFFGIKPALLIILAAEAMALFLATERFFSMRYLSWSGNSKESPAILTEDLILEENTTVTTEESQLLAENSAMTATMEAPVATMETPVVETTNSEIATLEATAPVPTEAAPVARRKRQPRVRQQVAPAPEKFDLEAALELAPDPSMDALIRAAKFPKKSPPGFVVGSGIFPETPEAELTSEMSSPIVRPEPVVAREEKVEVLVEAVERATKDYVIPQPVAAVEAPIEVAPAEIVEAPKATVAVEEKTIPAPAAAAASMPAVSIEAESGGFLDRAARLVIEEGRASVSLLQRRLTIPFSRASLLLDLLEKEGVVGPYRGGPSRDILLRLADWEEKAKVRSESAPQLPQA